MYNALLSGKKEMNIKKAKKFAELKAADDLSERIFHLQHSASCTKCNNLAQLQKDYDMLLDKQRKLDETIVKKTTRSNVK